MSNESRKSRRALVSLKVRLRSATVGDFVEQYSTNISRGGLFIASQSPMPVGTLLKFEFQLQDESKLIRGVGRVTWVREAAVIDDAKPAGLEPAGMGIRFIKMDAESRALVDSIVDQRLPADEHEAASAGSASDAQAGFFPPSTAGNRLPPVSERTQIRHAREFLASALGDADPPPVIADSLAPVRRTSAPPKLSTPPPAARHRSIAPRPGEADIPLPPPPRSAPPASAESPADVAEMPAEPSSTTSLSEYNHVFASPRRSNLLWVTIVLLGCGVGGLAFWFLRQPHHAGMQKRQAPAHIVATANLPRPTADVGAPPSTPTAGAREQVEAGLPDSSPAALAAGGSETAAPESSALPYILAVRTVPEEAVARIGAQLIKTPGELRLQRPPPPKGLAVTVLKANYRAARVLVRRKDFQALAGAQRHEIMLTLHAMPPNARKPALRKSKVDEAAKVASPSDASAPEPEAAKTTGATPATGATPLPPPPVQAEPPLRTEPPVRIEPPVNNPPPKSEATPSPSE